MDINRRSCAAVLGGLAFWVGDLARAQESDAFVGLWSGSVVDEGQMSRFRLSVSADGKATLILVDTGELPLGASQVTLTAPDIHLAWPEYQLRLDGRLIEPDTIDAVLNQGGVAIGIRLSRGDLFPLTTATPPAAGPMTPDLLGQLRLYAGTPAMGVGWMSAGQPRHVLASGLRSADAAVPVSATDKWHIGSCTKSMVAVMIARLVEAGLLDWTLTIGQALGGQASDMQPAFRDVTLLHLLSHHAGMVRDPPMAALMEFSFGPVPDPRPERLRYAQIVLGLPPVAAPGQQMLYSNAGYVVAAAMAESVAGAPWETLMTRYVFRPLRLRSAGFGPPAGLGRVDQPSGHQLGADAKLHPPATLKQADLPTAMAPAGDVHASLGDLLSYLEATRDHRTPFLSAATWRTLQTPPFGHGYALGWGVTAEGGLTHDGGNGQWLARLAIDRPSGFLAAIALNGVTPHIGMALEQTHIALRQTR